MSRMTEKPVLSKEERDVLESLSKDTIGDELMATRAKIVLMSADGLPDRTIARMLSVCSPTVRKRRQRFLEFRLDGLQDLESQNKAQKYHRTDTRKSILALLEQPPPKGQGIWNAKTIASELKLPTDLVWRYLKTDGFNPQRPTLNTIQTDSQFAQKVTDIIGLYLKPPESAIVISIDENISLQTRKNLYGHVLTYPNDLLYAIKSTHENNGVTYLSDVLKAATGGLHSDSPVRTKPIEFLEFLGQIASELPEGVEAHVIMDNYRMTEEFEEFFDLYPHVSFYATPPRASWLNLVEVFTWLFNKTTSKDANFPMPDQLAKAIEGFIEAYNENSSPFIWRKV